MTTSGRIPSFKEEEEDWDSYQERLECYFKVHKTEEDVKVDTLIMGLSASQYQTLKNLVSPAKPAEKPYADIVKSLSEHYGGGKNARTERSKFRNVYRKDGESIQSYAVNLKQAARYCKFGANLDQMLVDQLVDGVRSKSVSCKILEATEGLALTFKKAVELAVSVETTEKSASMYAKIQEQNQVYAVSGTNNPNSGRKGTTEKQQGGQKLCFRCNSPSHLADKCRHKGTECRKCKKKGHIAVACRGGKIRSQNVVEAETAEGAVAALDVPGEPSLSFMAEPEYEMFTVTQDELQDLLFLDSDLCMTTNDKKYFMQMNVNGADLEFELDTGAVVTCVSEETFKKICKPGETLIPANIKLRDYNKKPLDIAGVALVTVEYGLECKQLPLVVVRGGPCILVW